MTSNKTIIFVSIVIALVAGIGVGYFFGYDHGWEKAQKDTNTKSDLIRISSPRPNQKITSPLVITGEARGYWFFEATFPITLTDWDGKIITQHYAEAQDEWMSEDFVPFKAVLEFENPSWDAEFSKRGTLILHKQNASGLPEHDDALEFTVWFE
jgi:hypothetical protein